MVFRCIRPLLASARCGRYCPYGTVTEQHRKWDMLRCELVFGWVSSFLMTHLQRAVVWGVINPSRFTDPAIRDCNLITEWSWTDSLISMHLQLMAPHPHMNDRCTRLDSIPTIPRPNKVRLGLIMFSSGFFFTGWNAVKLWWLPRWVITLSHYLFIVLILVAVDPRICMRVFIIL